MLKVNVKWGKKKFDNLELNTAEPPVVFKTQLFTLSGVLPERQKIMVKGGMLKDDADWNQLGIKDGHTFMMMGSAEADIPQTPVEQPKFVEDMTEEQALMMQQAEYPPGLTNLGNTCYMNSTIQCLKAVPELHAVLKKYEGNIREGDSGNNLTVAMRDLFNGLNHSNQPIPPLVFLQVLRTAFPQFSQKDNSGHFMQQDAEECWSQIMHTLGQKLPKLDAPSTATSTTSSSSTSAMVNSSIAQLFAGETTAVTANSENPEEPKSFSNDSFHKLSCHIGNTTSFLLEGLKQALEEQFTKTSPTLGKEAKYVKTSKISKLPYYLTVQFVRFFWKQNVQMKAKIVKPVEFPFTLDVYDLCTDDLKAAIAPKRRQLHEIEEKKLQELTKKARLKQDDEPKKAKKKEEVAVSLDPTQFVNDTGMYELAAVLTHKGRSADSGHYIAWVKESEDQWLKFDDDRVSPVNGEEIKKLSGKGGGDWHMAYLCLYRSKKLTAEEESQVQPMDTSAQSKEEQQ